MTADIAAALTLIANMPDATAAAVAKEALARLSKGSPGAVVSYVIQARCVRDGQRSDWSEMHPRGKKDLYAAISDMDGFTAALKDPDAQTKNKAVADLLRFVRDLYQGTSTQLEMRIVKRTTADEVVEETVRAL